MKRKKRKGWQTIGAILLVIAILSYFGYQAYRSVVDTIDTELAAVHSVYKTIETKGLVYRTESLVSSSADGEPYYSIENGTRVSKGSVIASVYANADSGRIEQEISEIDEQIKAFKAILDDSSSGRLNPDTIKEQTSDTLLAVIADGDSGNFSDLSSYSFDILCLLSKKTLVTGSDDSFASALNEKIAELESEKETLRSSYEKPISSIKAGVAGYFADYVDGFETLLNTEELTDLTVDKLQASMNSAPSPDNNACGKIVSGYEWYIACVVPDSYYGELGVERKLSLRLPFVLDEAIPVEVEIANKDLDDKENMVVVFRCDQMNSLLSTIRLESVEIQLVEYTGLKVPKSAIIVNDKGETGVFVRSGNVVAFRKIESIYSQPADYAICKVVEKDGYLQMYDDIITEGRGLYDGKIIR